MGNEDVINIKKITDPNILDNCEIIKSGVEDYKIMFIPYIEKQGFLYTLFKNSVGVEVLLFKTQF